MVKHKPKKLTEKEQISLILENYKRKDVEMIPAMYVFDVYNLYPTPQSHTLTLAIMFHLTFN